MAAAHARSSGAAQCCRARPCRSAGGNPVEIWFADETRVGQKNKITRRWAKRGPRPSASKDQRTASAYIFGAICPDQGKGVASTACPCCAGPLHRISEDVSERLDIVPAQVRVLVIHRPKYACRACEDGVVQAPAPARLIEGGLPTDGTVAQVLVSKYADHLPLYRQAQIYARQGLTLDRST